MVIIKKDGTLEEYNEEKIISACNKASNRAMVALTDEDHKLICGKVREIIEESGLEKEPINVFDMHTIVVKALMELFPPVGKTYLEYRNYKLDFVKMLDKVYRKSQAIRYIGDVSNANSDSTLVSTQRSLIYGELNKNLYNKFFLNKDELQASNDGYIYIHDKKDRLDCVNCMIFDMKTVMDGGFEMGNLWYNEPKSIDTAFDVLSDVVLSAASQQYGGFTVPQIDKLLAKYAEKSYNDRVEKYVSMGITRDRAEEESWNDLEKDVEQGFQGLEYKFNSVSSSRGDYPFTTITFGIGTGKFESLISKWALRVRKNGQGKDGFKKPVLFPKLTFLYDEELHGEGKELEWLFDEAIECSKKAMYPDILSLSGSGYIPSIYKKYGKVISLMGCRASLSPWFVRGGMHPADDDDYPVFDGRCNLGAISLHLPMILAKARQENRDFYEVLDYYLEMIRQLHIRTYAFLGEKKASTNPLCFMQGGLRGGNLKADDKIKSLLPQMTMSFGITALNELQQLYNGKSIAEDGEFALEVMRYINDKVNEFKEEDNILYAIYGK